MALLWLSPLTALVVASGIAFPTVVPRALFFRTLAAGVALVSVVLLFTRGLRPTGRWDVVGLALAAHLLVGLAAAVLGPAPVHSLFGDLQRMGGALSGFYLLAVYLGMRTFFGEREWRVFFRLAALAVAVVAGVALVQATALGAPAADLTSLLGNVGYVAVLAYVGIAISALLLVLERSPAARAFALLTLLASTTVLLFLAQRTPILSLAAALVCAGLLWAYLDPRGRRSRTSLLLVGVVTAALAGAWLARDSAWLQRVPVVRRAALEGARGRPDLRLPLWEAGARAVAQRPVLGWGPENFDLAFGRNFPLEAYRYAALEMYVDRAHNAYLEAAVAAGVPGLLTFVSMWLAVLYCIARAHRARRLSRSETVILASAVVGYAVYLVFWFEDLSSFLLVVALAAFAGFRAGGRLASLAPPVRPRGSRAVLLVGVAATVGVLWYMQVVRVARAAVAVAPALDPAADTTATVHLAAYRRALDSGAPEAADLLTPYADYLAAFAREAEAVRQQPRLRDAVDAALQHAIARVDLEIGRDSRNDYWWLIRSRLLRAGALLYADARYHRLAEDALARAISMSPSRLLYRHELAALHHQRGRYDDALAVLEAAERVYDGHGATPDLEGRILLDMGRASEAERSLREAWSRNYWETQQLVTDLASRRLGEEGPAAAAGLIWEYLVGKYTVEAGPEVRTIEVVRSRDAAFAGAVPLLFLRGGEPDRAAEAAAWTARVLPPSRPVVTRFLRDLRNGRADAWLGRRSLLLDPG